jgi:hypothetical protein
VVTVGTYVYVTGLDRKEAVVGMLEAAELTWSTTDATLEKSLPFARWARPFDDTATMNAHFATATWISIMGKCGYLLVSKQSVSAEAITKELPSVADAIKGLVHCDGGCNVHTAHSAFWNAFLSVACVYEKVGSPEKALEWATAGMSTDMKKAGTSLPVSRVLLQSIQGRALAALGRSAEAGIVLEAAAEEAHKCGLYLYEAFALRDLKLLVLDGMGHGEHGSRRLGAVLRLLKAASAATLAPMMKGLDATQLLSLPPADANYRVVYAVEDSATAALRQELSGLTLKALKSRARELRVSEEALEDAEDEDDVYAAIVVLCVEATTLDEATGPGEAALQAELAPLKLKALKERAREVGVSADALAEADDADDVKRSVMDLIIVMNLAPATHEVDDKADRFVVEDVKITLAEPEPEPEPQPDAEADARAKAVKMAAWLQLGRESLTTP